MKISASLFACDKPIEYAQNLKLYEIDYFHLDFIENKKETVQLKEIDKLVNLQIPLDVHLIYSNISKDIITTLNNLAIQILSVQYESLQNVKDTVNNLQNFKRDFGFAITPNTDSEVLMPYKNIMKHILVMCSIPGISGAKFLENSYDYIKQIKERFPDIPIYVDGGMNEEIGKFMQKNGINITVLGSYLYKNRDNLQQAISVLKEQKNINIMKEKKL